MRTIKRVCENPGSTFPLQICRECGRVFDLTKEEDANDWTYGHDCEVED